MRKILRILPVILLVAALAWASDPWKGKPYQKWDKQDVMKVLNNSPWSKATVVTANWKPAGLASSMPGDMGRRGEPAEAPGVGAYPQATGQGGGGDGGGQGEGGAETAVPRAMFEARWASSLVIREAAARLQVLSGGLTQAQADRLLGQTPAGYQIWLLGTDMTPFEKVEESALKQGAYLELKTAHRRLPAASVEIQRGRNGKLSALIYTFPRTQAGAEPAIPANEKQAEFVCTGQKGLTLKFDFDLAKMAGQKGRDL
jgi:hypothetical protein